MKKILLFLSIMITISSFANDNGAEITIPIKKWIKAGNMQLVYPAFRDTENVNGQSFKMKNLFKFSYINLKKLRPSENDVLKWQNNNYKWKLIESNKDKQIVAGNKNDKNKIAYFVSYIRVDRWTKAKINIEIAQMCELYVDGKLISSKYTQNTDKDNIGKISKSLNLEIGEHIILIKTFVGKENKLDWKFNATIKFNTKYKNSVENIVSPKQIMNINHLLNGTKISSTQISPNGKYVILKYRKRIEESNKSESWAVVKEIESKKILQTFKYSKISGLQWLPKSNKVSYTVRSKAGSSIWLLDINSGSTKSILENAKKLAGYKWSPNENFIIYSINEKPKKTKGSMNHVWGMQDRWPWFKNRSFLYKIDVESKVKQRLTYGSKSTFLHDISPDSKRILFSQNRPDYKVRPFSKQDLYIMNLETFKHEVVWKDKLWGANCSFSPDGKKLLVAGSPSTFGKIGENISKSKIANNYDGQLYIYDLKTKKVNPITKKFKPSISYSYWNKIDNTIYVLAEVEDYKHLFKYNNKKNSFNKIETGLEVIRSINFSTQTYKAVYRGSSISTPYKSMIIDLKSYKYKVIENPEAKNYKNVVFGKTEKWNFKSLKGEHIIGRVYYPPNFDSKKKYPLIVNYYGGTIPVDRSFGGRYPLNIYTANGYIVYLLQPSGATGFGQEFSAKHVNDWGITTADEIIEGTKKFLKEHTFVDASKVGCIGASYGGFMTMYLQTKTDIFAAAISHAGISSISSYWGEGYWGYAYSAEASAESYPWNNKKLYVEQSPLFNADKVKTPLLLLHGSKDNNVPPGESIQMYTALKILGRTVEYIEIEGEGHHISTYSKRIEWHNTIFAWFDKWLKNQDEWWNNLYPDKKL